jgi:hypothetical protein
MKYRKSIFLYPDYYDATTATIRILTSSKDTFNDLHFFYWARTGKVKVNNDKIFDGIKKIPFTLNAKPRSLHVLWLFIKFQFWLLKNIIKEKPTFISAFTFYTIFPALIYKYFMNWKCKVLYDPRDYVAVCFRVNIMIIYVIQLLDNIVMQLADFIIFPDMQYFNYYGFFKLKSSKYFILPNSTSDQYEIISNEDIYSKYNIAKGKLLVPILGYFSETRGREVFYKIIEENIDSVHFIVAGDFRDIKDVKFFESKVNVTFLGKVSYVEALFIMKNSSFTPLLYDPISLNNKYAYPTKYYDSLMVGTPLLVSKGQCDIWNEIVDLNIGYGMEYNSLSEFKELLLELAKEENKVDKQRLRDVFLTKYDFNLFKNNLRQVYLKLTND